MDYSKKRPLWQWVLIYLVIGALVYAAIYYFFLRPSPPQPTTSPTGEVTPDLSRAVISISNSGYVPNTATIQIGGTVVWENQGSSTSNVSSAPHPAHTDYPPLNLGDIAPGASVSLKFDTPGTYYFHNHKNASQFGSITVK